MRIGKTRVQVWWHCLLRTFSKERHFLSLMNGAIHHCWCGYGMPASDTTRYRVVGVVDRQLAPMICREANGMIVTEPALHGEDCRCTFLELK